MRLDVTSVADILARVAAKHTVQMGSVYLPSRYYPWSGVSSGGKAHPLANTEVRLWCDPASNEWVATLDGVLRYFSNGNVMVMHDMRGMPTLRDKLERKFGLVADRGTALRGGFYTDSGSKVVVSSLRGSWVVFDDPATGKESAVNAEGAVFNAETGALVHSNSANVSVSVPKSAYVELRNKLRTLLTVRRAEARILSHKHDTLTDTDIEINKLIGAYGFDFSAERHVTRFQSVLRSVLGIETNCPMEVDKAVDYIIKNIHKPESTFILRRK